MNRPVVGAPLLDWARLAAVLLVVANHTSPLAGMSALGDFWLTRIAARVAVPFFLMVTGYFLARSGWRHSARQLKKLCLLYGVSILLYLPLNIYAASFEGIGDVLQKLFIDGTFYHLWYFPATITGIVVAMWLKSCFGLNVALWIAAALYVIGLGGDSYYGLVSQSPALEMMYGGIFTVTDYTRNGLFMTPLFILLGALGRRMNTGMAALGAAMSFGLMSAEGLWLHGLAVQRHDSMYVMLPFCMVCLFSLLLDGNRGEAKTARALSMWLYVLHPLCIVMVRGASKLVGAEILIDNPLLHYIAVLLVSGGLSGWMVAWQRARGKQKES